jgi:hypothetical protein
MPQETQWIRINPLAQRRELIAALQAELRRGIAFIESRIRINVPKGELEGMKARLSKLDALMGEPR